MQVAKLIQRNFSVCKYWTLTLDASINACAGKCPFSGAARHGKFRHHFGGQKGPQNSSGSVPGIAAL